MSNTANYFHKEYIVATQIYWMNLKPSLSWLCVPMTNPWRTWAEENVGSWIRTLSWKQKWMKHFERAWKNKETTTIKKGVWKYFCIFPCKTLTHSGCVFYRRCIWGERELSVIIASCYNLKVNNSLEWIII